MRSRNRKVTSQVEALDRRDVPSTMNHFEWFAEKAINTPPGLAKLSDEVDFPATKLQVLYIEYQARLSAGH